MSHNIELKNILDAQEKALKEHLKELEAKEKSLEQDKNQNQADLEQVKSDIIKTYEDISKISESINRLEQNPENIKSQIETIASGADLSGKIPEAVAGIVQFLDQSSEAIESQNINEKVLNELNARNPIVIEQQIDLHDAELKKPIENILSLEDAVKKDADDMKEKIEIAYDHSQAKEREDSQAKNDAKTEWEKDIDIRENELNKSYKSQMEALEKNKIMLEIQKEDAKKFNDAERKLENLKPMEELMKEEETNINNKFNDAMEEIKREREAIQDGIKREEFERQKLKHLDEPNGR